MKAGSGIQKELKDKRNLSQPTGTEILVLNINKKPLWSAGYFAFKITICILLAVFLLSSRMICSAEQKKPNSAISIYPKNTWYFQDANGKPFMLIGDFTWETFSGVDFDFVRMFESLQSRGLNLARVWLWWGCEELLLFAMANSKVIFAYLPAGGEVSIDLTAMKGKILAKWYSPLSGEFSHEFLVAGKPETVFKAPDKNDWALIIKSN